MKPGKIPVGKHGSQEVASGTMNAILKFAGIK
jgi:predicted RNA binding protein YcfA (HicA-like mRNA interferase family)